jgi:hypothetical protein
MTAKLPRISEQWVYDGAVLEGQVRLDSAAWFVWLAAETTTRFSYPLFDPLVGYIVGFMTVRKERRQRGSAYWVAYRRVGGQVHKVYLGRSEAVTAERLHASATRLHGKEGAGSEQSGQ